MRADSLHGRGSEAAKRRAKTHFGREHPIAVFCLAQRASLRLDGRQRLGQPERVENKKLPEVGLSELKRSFVGEDGLE